MYERLQEDMKGVWQTVDELKEEKEGLQHELNELQQEFVSSVDSEKSRSDDLEVGLVLRRGWW